MAEQGLPGCDARVIARLKLALSSTDFGEWSWMPRDNRVSLSPRAAAAFGVADNCVTWPAVKEQLRPEDGDRLELLLQQSFREVQPFELECRISVSDQSVRWLWVKGNPLLDAQGVVQELVCVVSDVTERKVIGEPQLALNSEQSALNLELRRRIAEWESLFDTAPIAIWLAHDPQCKVITGNHYTNAILGVPNGTNISSTSESPRRVPFEILENGKPITANQFPIRIACFQGVPVRNCEQQVRTPDGRSVFVLVNAVPLYDEHGQIRGALATGLDITERKKTEAALRESEQRFRLMADASPALIWMAGPDKLCTWVNKAWLTFVGDSLESQLGDGWMHQVHPDDLQYCLESYLSAFKSRASFELEYRLRRSDGEYRWLLTKGRPLFGIGQEFAGFIGSCIDVTESKRQREELESLVAKRTAQMRESISHLETFSYTVSHDMRAPLRSMEGFSQALLEDYADALDETGRAHLHRIIRSAQKLDLLICHVLEYSKVATGRVHLRSVSLDEVLKEVTAQHPELAPENARLSIELEVRMVTADRTMLSHIFSNLLVNSAKFVAPGVKPEIHIRSRLSGGMVRVEVQDNGTGIDAGHRDRIFEIFSKLHPDRERESTGIGLAIVKKAVQMLGGQVGLDVTCTKGSRFWFTIKP